MNWNEELEQIAQDHDNYMNPKNDPHSSDCAIWVAEPCDCMFGKRDGQSQVEDNDEFGLKMEPKKKVVRQIVYEGDEKWVNLTLSRSIPDGNHPMGGKNNTITITTIEGEMPEMTGMAYDGSPRDKKIKP